MGRWASTHARLSKAALDLFGTQGYAQTTTAQIAAQAGVSEVTLFRHFPTKESLLFQDPFDPVIAHAVLARPATEPDMRALTEGIRDAWLKLDASALDALSARLHVASRADIPEGAIARNSQSSTTALTQALIGRGTAPIPAHAAASAVIAGLGAALLDWTATPEVPLSTVIHSVLDLMGGQ